MNDNMNEKYQQYYNQILVGTLTDALLKSVSYQANIKLANELIAVNEKTISDLQSSADTSKKELQENVNNLKKELESIKANRTLVENSKITQLENNIKNHLTTISKLQNDLIDFNRVRSEYENIKHQVQHLETFRVELGKSREEIKNLQEKHRLELDSIKSNYENIIEDLNNKLTPTKKKKVVAQKEETIKVLEQNVPTIKKIAISKLPEEVLLKDGGSF